MTDSNMDNSQHIDTGVNESGENIVSQDNGNSKTFTQDELNAIVTKRVAQASKKYESIDVEEYHQLKTAREQAEEAQMMKRQEFDKILKQTKEKSQSELNQLREELTKVRVDGALVSAASKHKATNPDHVAQLLRASVKLDETGIPVVLDKGGEIRYNTDAGEPYSIDDLVTEFMNTNPYFKSAGKPGTSSSSNTRSAVNTDIDLSNLDLTRSDHRKLYEKMLKEGKI